MPLTGTHAAAGSSIGSMLLGLSDSDKADPTIVWTKICQILFPHLVTNTIVNFPIPVAVTGSPTAQAGGTTAPGTIA